MGQLGKILGAGQLRSEGLTLGELFNEQIKFKFQNSFCYRYPGYQGIKNNMDYLFPNYNKLCAWPRIVVHFIRYDKLTFSNSYNSWLRWELKLDLVTEKVVLTCNKIKVTYVKTFQTLGEGLRTKNLHRLVVKHSTWNFDFYPEIDLPIYDSNLPKT